MSLSRIASFSSENHWTDAKTGSAGLRQCDNYNL